MAIDNIISGRSTIHTNAGYRIELFEGSKETTALVDLRSEAFGVFTGRSFHGDIDAPLLMVDVDGNEHELPELGAIVNILRVLPSR